VRIFVSGGLDEHDLAAFVAHGAPIDAAGVGTRVGVSADWPYLDSAYKLVAYDGRAVAKFSTGKATLPGAKQIFRSPGLRDQIGQRHERPPRDSVGILEPVMRAGRPVHSPEVLAAARSRFEGDLHQLLASARELTSPHPPETVLTPALQSLNEKVQGALRSRVAAEATK
jgi:nicotinate phosphoribosyltransferase